MCWAELWLLLLLRSGVDWGHTLLMTDHQVMIYFKEHETTWAQVVGSPWQWRRELSRGNLSYHRLKRTHFPHSTNSKKLYCPSPWLCNTKGVPAKHVLMAHVQPPRWLQRIHAERKKNIPKSNRKTSYANKALMSLEFETEDRHKIVLPAVQARQFTDQEGGG